MRGFFKTMLGLTGLLAMLSGPVQAGDNLVVVELYTSQGCSSCPPADAFLNKLAKRDDVIALGLHVDYWDYLGWKDELANPNYTARQRSYARVANSRTIYTPQMIIGGQHHVVGHKVMEAMDHIARERAQNSGVSVDLVRQGNRVVISANAARPANMTVVLVRYEPRISVAIRRGENAGKTIEYSNTVTQWQTVQKWNGSAPLSVAVDAAGDQPVVAIIQAAGPGQVLAATQLR